MNDETDRRELLKRAGVGFATASTSGCLGEKLPFVPEADDREEPADSGLDVSREPDTIGNNTSGVIERTESRRGENTSPVDIDELRHDMETPEPLSEPGTNAFSCTQATVEHSYVEEGDKVDFYNYRVENDHPSRGRVFVTVFFYNSDGSIMDSEKKRVFVDAHGSTSGRIAVSQSNRQYPVYLMTVTEQDCS
jgi:hypothetical protein